MIHTEQLLKHVVTYSRFRGTLVMFSNNRRGRERKNGKGQHLCPNNNGAPNLFALTLQEFRFRLAMASVLAPTTTLMPLSFPCNMDYINSSFISNQ